MTEKEARDYAYDITNAVENLIEAMLNERFGHPARPRQSKENLLIAIKDFLVDNFVGKEPRNGR